MCRFDVTRSLTAAGRLWSKDVNRTKIITADTIISSKVRSLVTQVAEGMSDFADSFRAPQMATLVA